jgi:hypothetical protein
LYNIDFTVRDHENSFIEKEHREKEREKNRERKAALEER